MAAASGHHACGLPGGYTVLTLKFSQDEDDAALHQLCVKEHRVRADAQRPTDRTLFVLNIPPYCSEAALTDVFSQFGPVQSVELSEKPGVCEETTKQLSKFFRDADPKSFRIGYIIFRNSSSVAAAKRHRDPLVLSNPEKPVRTGLSKWIQLYSESLVKPTLLQQHVDEFMKVFDMRKEEEAERQQQEAEQEDEEGWVKVTKTGRSGKSRPHSERANQRTLQKEDKKRKRKELLNFYSWQHRNTQREHIAELRRKFEEDKQRVAVMRAQRKFRPY